MQIFQIDYSWYDGDNGSTFLAKRVSDKQFENDLLEAKKFVMSLKGKTVQKDECYLGKGYDVECLPEYYEQIIYYMTEKLNYIVCYYNNKVNYDVWESNDGIEISENKQTIERTILE